GAVLTQRVGLPDSIDAYDAAEAPGPPGLDSRQGVLEHGTISGLDAELAGAGEERVGRRLSLQVLAVGDHAVDDRLEQVGDAGRPEDLLRVRAGRDDGPAQASVPSCLDIANGSLVDLDAVAAEQLEH